MSHIRDKVRPPIGREVERYKICEICGQIFDEHDPEQVVRHTTQPHEPLLREHRQPRA